MLVRNPATGLIGSVVRGPYRKYGQDYLDVVFPNDFGEPGLYSQAYRVGQLDVVEDSEA